MHLLCDSLLSAFVDHLSSAVLLLSGHGVVGHMARVDGRFLARGAPSADRRNT